MEAAHRRVIAAVSLGALMLSIVTGLICAVPPEVIFVRSLWAALVTGAVSGIVVLIFENVWTR